MANESHVTIVGNITDDPELRFTLAGQAVATLTVATTPTFYDSSTQEWKETDTIFMRCNIWRQLGENVAESLRRGNRVVVVGRIKQSNWEDRETGNNRSRIEIDVDDIGASMRFATVKVSRAERQNDNDEPAERPKSKAGRNNGRQSTSRARARA